MEQTMLTAIKDISDFFHIWKQDKKGDLKKMTCQTSWLTQ